MKPNDTWGAQPTAKVIAPKLYSNGWWYWLGFAVAVPPLMAIASLAGDGTLYVALAITIVWGAVLGYRDRRLGLKFARGNYVALGLLVICMLGVPSLIAYTLGYYIFDSLITYGRGRKEQRAASKSEGLISRVMGSNDPYLEVLMAAANDSAGGGGYIGWSSEDANRMMTVSPRVALLVIGPQGSGKSSGAIEPSVLLAPGPCVSSTIKLEVMMATYQHRSRLGQQWHFDPAGETSDGLAQQGILPVHWSPLVGVRSWDQMQMRAYALANPKIEQAQGNGKHFMEGARNILASLMYAAFLDGRDMGDVARWAATLNVTDEASPSYTRLDAMTPLIHYAAEEGDVGLAAQIALDELESYLAMDVQELGKYTSSLRDILAAYNLVSVRKISQDTNFDPDAFVRSRDTLHITVPTEHQNALGPIVAGLLEAIRFAQYSYHRNVEAGIEPDPHMHLTFVLDEVTNTAPMPIPKLVSEAGGQKLHLIIALQSLSQANERWRDAAKDFLSMFNAKLILPGVVDPAVTHTLSEAAGHYDRVIEGVSQSTAYVGPYSRKVTQQQPNWTIQRQRVLEPDHISRPLPGHAVAFFGSQWFLTRQTPVHADPFWQHIMRNPYPIRPVEESRDV